MGTTFSDPTNLTLDRLEKTLDRYHLDLRQAGVEVNIVMCNNDSGPAVKVHGVPALASIKINSLLDRKEGKKDATIKLDEDAWDLLNGEEQTALLSHELRHLRVLKDDAGVVKRDDIDRPRLKMRPHDQEAGLFYDNVSTHGEAAPEVAVYRQIVEKMGELLGGKTKETA